MKLRRKLLLAGLPADAFISQCNQIKLGQHGVNESRTKKGITQSRRHVRLVSLTEHIVIDIVNEGTELQFHGGFEFIDSVNHGGHQLFGGIAFIHFFVEHILHQRGYINIVQPRTDEIWIEGGTVCRKGNTENN